MSENEKKGKPPVYKSRVGSIEASVWEQVSEKGNFFTVSFHRNYKDEEDWKTTQSLRVGDLADLRLALEDCHRFCRQTSKQEKKD